MSESENLDGDDEIDIETQITDEDKAFLLTKKCAKCGNNQFLKLEETIFACSKCAFTFSNIPDPNIIKSGDSDTTTTTTSTATTTTTLPTFSTITTSTTPATDDTTDFLAAVSRNDYVVAMRLIWKVSIESLDSRGYTPLIIATMNDDLLLVKLLLRNLARKEHKVSMDLDSLKQSKKFPPRAITTLEKVGAVCALELSVALGCSHITQALISDGAFIDESSPIVKEKFKEIERIMALVPLFPIICGLIRANKVIPRQISEIIISFLSPHEHYPERKTTWGNEMRKTQEVHDKKVQDKILAKTKLSPADISYLKNFNKDETKVEDKKKRNTEKPKSVEKKKNDETKVKRKET